MLYLVFCAMAILAAGAVRLILRIRPLLSFDSDNNKASRLGRRSSAVVKASATRYVPFQDAKHSSAVIVDCTHPSLPTFTHHKGHNNPPNQRPSDTSTGLVLNALEDGERGSFAWLSRPAVSVNHFDGDALFSAWSLINPQEALCHSDLLRSAASLHDFRELPMLEVIDSEFKDDAVSLRGDIPALALCCWINSTERKRFTPAYDDKDADDKFEFFLEELGNFLEEPQRYTFDWIGEYESVLAEYALIAEKGQTKLYPDIGVAVVTLYGQHSFEVESKYTQFVNLHSRPVHARLDMAPLASALNRIDPGRHPGTSWNAPSLVDTGPLLRLDISGEKLSKKERYGHPTARPMYTSGLHGALFQAVVTSFFEHGLKGVQPRVGGWSWEALHDLNSSIDWQVWETSVLPKVLLRERGPEIAISRV